MMGRSILCGVIVASVNAETLIYFRDVNLKGCASGTESCNSISKYFEKTISENEFIHKFQSGIIGCVEHGGPNCSVSVQVKAEFKNICVAENVFGFDTSVFNGWIIDPVIDLTGIESDCTSFDLGLFGSESNLQTVCSSNHDKEPAAVYHLDFDDHHQFKIDANKQTTAPLVLALVGRGDESCDFHTTAQDKKDVFASANLAARFAKHPRLTQIDQETTKQTEETTEETTKQTADTPKQTLEVEHLLADWFKPATAAARINEFNVKVDSHATGASLEIDNDAWEKYEINLGSSFVVALDGHLDNAELEGTVESSTAETSTAEAIVMMDDTQEGDSRAAPKSPFVELIQSSLQGGGCGYSTRVCIEFMRLVKVHKHKNLLEGDLLGASAQAMYACLDASRNHRCQAVMRLAAGYDQAAIKVVEGSAIAPKASFDVRKYGVNFNLDRKIRLQGMLTCPSNRFEVTVSTGSSEDCESNGTKYRGIVDNDKLEISGSRPPISASYVCIQPPDGCIWNTHDEISEIKLEFYRLFE